MATISLEQQNTAITTATTTTIMNALSGANDEARIKPNMINIRNKGTASNTITIIRDLNGTDYELNKRVLLAGDEWQNTFDLAITGTGTTLEITTSSTSALDVCLSYIKKAV